MSPKDGAGRRKGKRFPDLPMSLGQYWGRLYESEMELDRFWFVDKLPNEVLTLMDGPAVGNRRALDIGCGVGNLTGLLAPHFQAVVGVDFAESGIRRATDATRARDPAPRFVVGDATRLPFADGSFDYVFDRGCLQVIPLKRWSDYFAGVERVLKQGARFQPFIRFGKKRRGVGSTLRHFLRRSTRAFAKKSNKDPRSLQKLLDHLPPSLVCETAEPLVNPERPAVTTGQINIVCRKS